MKKNIPVIIHHECRNLYAKECLRMAEKYNEHVVFLGDESNRDFSKNWVNTDDYCNEEWQRFKKTYKNMSFYDDGYAIKIFKRFFAMKEYLRIKGISECVLIDSDVLSFCDYSKIEIFNECDATLFIPREEKQGSNPFTYGNMYWGASAGTSYFKYEVLEDIINFIIYTYENDIQILEKKWEWHKNNNYGGGVCEMTLLFLWYLQTNYKVINTKNIFEGKDGKYVIDNDVRTANDRCNFEKYPKKNIEKVEFIDGIPYLLLSNGEKIRTVCLHFGGETKKYMKAFRSNNNFIFNTRLNMSYISLKGYNMVAKFYVNHLKKYIGKYRKPKYGKTE